jgi:hypothetical protein
VGARAGPGCGLLAGGGEALSDGEYDRLAATIQTRLTRIMWLWWLGEAWFTVLIVGAVLMYFWAR